MSKKRMVYSYIYERYINTMNTRLAKAVEISNAYKRSKAHLIKEVEDEFTNVIKKPCTINFDKLTITDDFQFIGRSKDLTPILKQIAKINNLLKETEKKIDYYTTCASISKDAHDELLGTFNDKVNDAILLQGYSFYLGSGLSSIRICTVSIAKKIQMTGDVKALGKRIDWNGSNKLKKKILDRGGIPLVTIKNDKQEIISDNGGENWLVYYTNNNKYYYRFIANPNTPNVAIFSFNPTKTNVSRLNILAKELKYSSLYEQELASKEE